MYIQIFENLYTIVYCIVVAPKLYSLSFPKKNHTALKLRKPIVWSLVPCQLRTLWPICDGRRGEKTKFGDGATG